MFYVANVITLGVVLELLWKFTLLVYYQLNIFQPPWVNQFDILALLFGNYARFISVYKNGILWLLESPAFYQFVDVTYIFNIVSVV